MNEQLEYTTLTTQALVMLRDKANDRIRELHKELKEVEERLVAVSKEMARRQNDKQLELF